MKNRITLLKATMIGAITCQLIICHVSILQAKVHLHVYEVDGKTLFDDRDIMVGTELTLIVSAYHSNFWSGGLFVWGYDRALASLSARAFDPNSRDWVESHFEAAGENARVTQWKDSDIWGFDLYTSDSNSVAGDWFIIDYKAIDVGDPNVGFYEHDVSWNDPNGFVYFSHIPTRDFNNDKTVNLSDYSILASYWLSENCCDPNWCDKTDIDTDGDVDIDDLSLFLDYWMWRNPCLDSSIQDPNVILDSEMLLLNVPGPEEMFAVQALPQTQPEEEIDISELMKLLEDIWLEDNGIRELISEEQWDQFIQSVKDSAQ